MERRVWIVSALAALAGIGVLRLHLQRLEQELSGGPMTRALVLARDLPPGAVLSRDALGERDLPRAYLESRHVRARDLEQVIGTRLGVAGRATEALLWTDLAGMRERPRSLASLVPEGMRAFALAQASSALDELLAPGDRVDVLLTLERPAERDAQPTRNVAENLLVLAVGEDLGHSAGRLAAARTPRRGRGVTLAADPEQSLRLAAAERAGQLRLVLRNPDDARLIAGEDPRPVRAADDGAPKAAIEQEN